MSDLEGGNSEFAKPARPEVFVGASRHSHGTTCWPPPALAFDSHPPLRDVGARWAAANLPTAMPRPAEDRGIDVVTLGEISESALVQQIGLSGHLFRQSAVTLAPGGKVAAKGIASGPGFLIVTGGAWTEGAPGIERVHTALVAPMLTIGSRARWYFNRGTVPATALVIEIMPSVDTDVGKISARLNAGVCPHSGTGAKRHWGWAQEE